MDSIQTSRILRQHIITDKLLGMEFVPQNKSLLDNSALAQNQNTSLKPSPASPRPLQPARSRQPDNLKSGFSNNTNTGANKSSATAPAPSMPALSKITQIEIKPLKTKEKIEILEKMAHEEVSNCTKCELHKSRIQTVFGAGDVDARLMFVGEGPGQNEDEQGLPFVGRSGKLLTDMIKAIGLDREQVYIANVVKCRPPNNRTPNAHEAATCGGYLQRQISIVQPKVIVTLGGPAAKLLLNPQQGITRIRGTWHEYSGVAPAVPVMPTFHPAYILRSYTKENRAKVWSDLQAAAKRAGIKLKTD